MAVPSNEKLITIFRTNAVRTLEIEDDDLKGCKTCGSPGTENWGMDYEGFRRAIGELLLVHGQGA